MKRKRVLSLTATVTVGALVLIGASILRSPAFAKPPPPCNGSFQTAVDWGHGANCAAATRDLFDKVFAAARMTCGMSGVCDQMLIITANCHDTPPEMGGQGKEVDGFLQHGCACELF